MYPLISILIPNYNKGPYLRETLEHVLAQTYTNWECIIVDDHSTDDSWEILNFFSSKDHRIKIFKRPDTRKSGGNAARNYAFENSQGEFIQWLDSDDNIFPTKLEIQCDLLRNSKYDFILCDFLDSGIKRKLEFGLKRNEIKNRPINYLKGEFWFQTSVPLFKKDYLLSLGFLFNENIRRHQEGEFFTRILLKRPKIGHIKEVLVERIETENSISSEYKKLSISEKISLDFPVYKSLFGDFKNDRDIQQQTLFFFNRIFISMIQYGNLNFRDIFWIFLNILKNGSLRQKIILIKSVIFRLLNARRE